MSDTSIQSDINNLICETVKCYAEATTRVSVQSRNKEIRSVNICENCRNENGINAEPILIDDKDVPLNFNIKTKCTCHNCNNEADIFLEIVSFPISGYYCESCAIDIKLHGIAEEVILE